MRRSSRLRPISQKTAKRNAEAKPDCDEFRASVDCCEWCQRHERSCGDLDMHEISRGSDRQKSRGVRAVSLMLCRGCHIEIAKLPRAAQLALVYLNRPGDYCLKTFHEITCRVYPDQAEVDLWIRRLLLVSE